jgi:hypothetical protein
LVCIDTYPYWIEHCKKEGVQHPFGDEEQQAFAEIGYSPDLTSPLLTFGFVTATTIVCDDYRGKGISAGNLCSKIIDYCIREIKTQVKGGLDGSNFYWPPDFQEHRDGFRAKERNIEYIADRAHA